MSIDVRIMGEDITSDERGNRGHHIEVRAEPSGSGGVCVSMRWDDSQRWARLTRQQALVLAHALLELARDGVR